MEQGFPHNWRADEAHWSGARPAQGVTRLNLGRRQAQKRSVPISIAQ